MTEIFYRTIVTPHKRLAFVRDNINEVVSTFDHVPHILQIFTLNGWKDRPEGFAFPPDDSFEIPPTKAPSLGVREHEARVRQMEAQAELMEVEAAYKRKELGLPTGGQV